MILKIRHRGLRAYYEKGQTKGLTADWLPRLDRILMFLDRATEPEGMNIPGFNLHPLKGNYKGFWSVRLTGNWRVIFRFEDEDATDVDIVDYH